MTQRPPTSKNSNSNMMKRSIGRNPKRIHNHHYPHGAQLTPKKAQKSRSSLLIAIAAWTLGVLLISFVKKNEVGSRELAVTAEYSTNPTSAMSRTSQQPQQNYHILFSTSCDAFQNWQSTAFFHFAHKVQQPGRVTRIVSGCRPKQAEILQYQFEQQIAPLNPLFQLHITPDYNHGSGDQKYWNKPLGILSYLEEVLGYGSDGSKYNVHDDDIIIILDPDMMLLRPITSDFSDYTGGWTNDLLQTQVQHGKPIAQRYEYGAQWVTSLNGRTAEVVGPKSPALNISLKDADAYYPAGPPYLATGRDMYHLVTHWVQFLPKIYEIFPKFMAEMHGYSLASAHLQLPHRLAKGFMVSTVGAYENFDFVDQHMNRTSACQAAAERVESSEIESNEIEQSMPFVLHYCQRYALGRLFFSKYKLNEQFFECDAPLLREPPLNVGDIYDWYIFPNGYETADFSEPSKQPDIARNAWMMCSMLFGLNDAATSLKQRYCETPNLEKTWHFHDEDKFQAMLDDPTNPFQNKTEQTISEGR